MASSATGRCLCGAIRFAVAGPAKWVAHCHCESCRRATGAPVTTYVCVRAADFAWTAGVPSVHESSPGVRRRFCGACGSPLSYDAERWPGEIHLHVSALDRPQDFPPQLHAYFAERIPWLDLHDRLPRFREVGGRGVEPMLRGPAPRED